MSTRSILKRCAFCIAATILSACGGTQSQNITTNAMPQIPTALANSAHARSWMLPETKNGDLLYVSDGYSVYVYSYPTVKLVGTLTGFHGPSGMCVDKYANIWITNYRGNTIVKYAHGGTAPIKTLTVPKISAQGCSIDSISGNLAVVGYGPESPGVPGRIVVYPAADGTPTIYRVPFGNTSFCGYDNGGNLFVVGFGYNENPAFVLTELQNGGRKFAEVSFGRTGPPSGYATPVQWDGRYLAIGSPEGIVRYAISGLSAVRKGTTRFDDMHMLFNAWIQGSKVVVVNLGGSGGYPPVQIDKYPAGGNPIETINGGFYGNPFGVAVSSAPR